MIGMNGRPLSNLVMQFLALPEDVGMIVRTRNEVNKIYKYVRRNGGKVEALALVNGKGWRVYKCEGVK